MIALLGDTKTLSVPDAERTLSLTLPHKGGGNGETDPSNVVNTHKTRGTQP